MRRPRLLALAAPALACAPRRRSQRCAPRARRFRATTARIPSSRTEWWYVTGQARARRARASASRSPSSAARADVDAGHAEPLRRRSSCCSRMPRSPTCRAAACARPARRARRLRHRRARRAATPTCACATGRWRASPDDAAIAHDRSDERRLRLRPRPRRRRKPLLLQGEAGLSRKGPRPDAGEPLLQRAAARGERRARARSGQRFAGDRHAPGSITSGASEYLAPEARGLGLDRHEPRRRQRAHRLSPAARATARPLWAGGASARQGRGGRAQLRARGGATSSRCALDAARLAGELPGDWRMHDAGRRVRGKRRIDDQELDSRGSTGAIYWEGSERPARRATDAGRPRLPGDDGLRGGAAGRVSGRSARHECPTTRCAHIRRLERVYLVRAQLDPERRQRVLEVLDLRRADDRRRDARRVQQPRQRDLRRRHAAPAATSRRGRRPRSRRRPRA